MPRIAFFPNIRPGSGSGHITRCLALAQSLAAEQAEIIFIGRADYAPALSNMGFSGYDLIELQSQGPIENDLTELGHALDSRRVLDWLVVDDYEVDEGWLRKARRFARRLAVIDDLANRFFDCDLLLNQNLGYETRYDTLLHPSTRQLIGPKFALLRGEFGQARRRGLRARQGEIKRVLIFLGGDDVHDNTGEVVKALASRVDFTTTVDIVVGRSYRYYQRLKTNVAAASFKADIHQDVSAKEMADLMLKADLAIGTAGSTSWERCCLGLPSILLVIAENQRRVAEELERFGCAVSLGWHEDVGVDLITGQVKALMTDQTYVRQMSTRCLGLVDGLGAERVSRVLGELTSGQADQLHA